MLRCSWGGRREEEVSVTPYWGRTSHQSPAPSSLWDLTPQLRFLLWEEQSRGGTGEELGRPPEGGGLQR